MKLLISLLLATSIAHARVIKLTYASAQEAHAEHIMQVMQSQHHIPGDFIELSASTEPCSRVRSELSWHLCINDNGDLQEVAVDISFIQETLRVFL